jgi:4-carboxymuconolactone decarboxylase
MATQTQGQTGSERPIQGQTEEARYERGLKKMTEIYGVPVEEFIAPLGDLGRYMVEFPYGDIYSRDGLAARDREIATIAMLTALGGREPQLRVHMNSALNVGLTPDELYEIILHTLIFAGFPTAINALSVLGDVLSKRGGGQKSV